MSSGKTEYQRSEKHAEHLASCVLFGSMGWNDAVDEYRRVNNRTHTEAMAEFKATYMRVEASHEPQP